MKIVVHLTGMYTPVSDEIEATSISWHTETLTIDTERVWLHYPREKVIKVEVIK